MPSWWTRKSQTAAKEVNSKEHEEDKELLRNNEASRTRMNKKRQKIKKPKSFDESHVLSSHSFPKTSLYLKASSSVSPKEASFYGGLRTNTLRETAEKEAYPLPRPSKSLDLTSVKFNQKGVGFASEVPSSSSSPSSGSSTSAEDHGDFGSFRVFEETEWDSGFKVSFQRAEASRRRKSLQYPQLKETRIESQTINDENWRNLCHPLPLPPCCVDEPSQHMQSSKWIKGRLLGRGSFGQVYAGFNCTNGQLCAIKEVRAITEDQNSQDCLKQLNQEVAVLSQLSHPNIVEYYGSELGKGQLSVYLEYVSGGSIHKLLQEYGPFKEPLMRNYTGQILHALAYLHARNTVHRDIKGTNILVDPNGEIKLADFGMAKHMTSSTSIVSFNGSPHWMAPEVILNTKSFGLAADIWSLGCTVIEMATSKPPWSEYEGVAAIFKIADSKDFPKIPAHLSANAQNFLKLCLQRDPLARPTAAQLLQHPFVQDHS
ncbi:hypothetical protein L6164_016272 [Bauhinia variegata]|uniref:Uncharacterized protein n=1 Tax=Bauhinia variegata TaxID=167791 RepID=A0ACB9NP89_BAUVA|nr:hypothetical protein L6164_016272 [Bauhinia variegata]